MRRMRRDEGVKSTYTVAKASELQLGKEEFNRKLEQRMATSAEKQPDFNIKIKRLEEITSQELQKLVPPHLLQFAHEVDRDMRKRHEAKPEQLPGGEWYKGNWVQDKRHGHGIGVFPGGEIYRGEWKQDRINGNGVLRNAEGDVIEGRFRDGELVDGQAKVLYANGEYYDGRL